MFDAASSDHRVAISAVLVGRKNEGDLILRSVGLHFRPQCNVNVKLLAMLEQANWLYHMIFLPFISIHKT